MWTWQFGLNILTTLSIVSIVAGLGYKVLDLFPFLRKLDLQRIQDNLVFQKWGVLTDTLKDLKDEIRVSCRKKLKQRKASNVDCQIGSVRN